MWHIGQTVLSHSKSAKLIRRLALVVGLLWTVARPIAAAVELESFRVFSLSDRIRIEWVTSQEYNVQGFQLYCKREVEPDSEYHAIGPQIPARGSLEQGDSYFAAFSRLDPGVSYCFRLVEVTTDDEPGEVFEACGYGIGVTPTPTTTPTPTFTATPTETPTPTFTPTPTLTSASPLPTPTPTPTLEGTDQESGVAVILPTSTPQPEPTFVVLTATPTATPALLPPTPTPLPTATPAPLGISALRTLGLGTSPVSNLLVLVLCLGGLGLGLMGVMTLLGSVFYLRSRD